MADGGTSDECVDELGSLSRMQLMFVTNALPAAWARLIRLLRLRREVMLVCKIFGAADSRNGHWKWVLSWK